MYFLLLAELLGSSIALVSISIQVIHGIFGIKCIEIITVVILVHAIRASCLFEEDTGALGDVVYIGIMLFLIFGVTIVFLVRNPRDQLTSSINIFSLTSLLIICSGFLGFEICAPPVILCLQGTKQINTLFGSHGDILVANLLLDFTLNYCR